jgi:beta-N-acetylhexosaminidase
LKQFYKIFAFLAVIIAVSFYTAPSIIGETNKLKQTSFPFGDTTSKWVDSVFNSLSEEERIAQLFMVAAYSNKDKKHTDEILSLVKEYKIGGLMFMQGGPVRQAVLCNKYQEAAKTPLLISIDGEWGLAMRLDSTIKYPRQMTLGAIKNDSLIYRMGNDIAEQCKRLGIHVNFAPVVDVNNNPNNPVINSRSFGEDKYNVARKATAYMKGMQDKHILATAKHFPGHGDTDTDSHKALPIIKHSPQRIDSLELYPFKELFKQGLGSVMVAHLFIPSLDSTHNQASTLSKKIVTNMLRDELGFTGLAFTDALNMKGVSAYNKPGEVDLKALLAGNDVLLFAEDVPVAINKIKQAIALNELTWDWINERCRKILAVKQWVGLDNYSPIELKNLHSDLNKPQYEYINRKLSEASLTLIKNNKNILPLKQLDTLLIASVAIGETKENKMQNTLSKYAQVTHFSIDKSPSKADTDSLLNKLSSFNLVIIGIHNTNESPSKNFGVTNETIDLISAISNRKKSILLSFANPYSFSRFKSYDAVEALVLAYQDTDNAQDYAAQLVFGGIKANGRLPVSVSPHFNYGAGIDSDNSIRLKYTMPEEVFIDSKHFTKIDEIVKNGIAEKAFPGCQILIAKDGNVIYQKSFGHHTYESKRRVKNDDLYDLASITKIAASTLSLMKLQDDNLFSLNYNLCDYLPEFVEETPYFNMNLREMMAHQAGLVSWIPFYEKTLIKGQLKNEIYNNEQTDEYPFRVAENLYINKLYPGIIYKRILETPVNKNKEYKYSDIGYYFIKKIIEKQTEQPMNVYVKDNFYTKLGAYTTGYYPRESFPLEKIVPTEYDLLFRKQLIHGDVHDPGAAMLGGVGGHAGLFSSANDLAKIMQMLLNMGNYGQQQFLSEKVITEYSKCQFCAENRRGAGFDKPASNGNGPTCNCVSIESYGHTGFTGTMSWVDPNEKIIYIFLSNRVYPNADNNKLLKMGIRTQIQQVIYDAVNASKAVSKK